MNANAKCIMARSVRSSAVRKFVLFNRIDLTKFRLIDDLLNSEP